MKAVGYKTPGELHGAGELYDINLPIPKVSGRDLLVKIDAVSVNPVDTKVRANMDTQGHEYRVLGWDAVGVVEAVGSDVTSFEPGDTIYYAGSLSRQGTNAEYHLVDERIVAQKPKSLSDAEAAALPLTAITAWEMLFDRLDVENPPPEGGNTILVIGGAGGVGSITIQILRALTDLTVIATASRPETVDWVRECGAHHVINHNEPMAPQIKKIGIGAPGFVFSTTMTDKHYDDIVELIAPQGRFGLIDDPETLDAKPLKLKSVSLRWELMFTRPSFETSDMDTQGKLLAEIAALVDRGKIKSTLTEIMGTINASNLTKAHEKIEKASTKGKIVLEGF